MGNRSSGNNRSSTNNRGFGVLSLTFVGDLSDKSVDGVGAITNMLGAAVREVDIVRTLGTASSVTGLGSIEVGGGVVVSDGVVKCVGGDLVRVGFDSSVSYNRGVVGRGSLNHRSGVDYWSSMNHRSNSPNHWSSVNHGRSVNHRCYSMSNG